MTSGSEILGSLSRQRPAAALRPGTGGPPRTEPRRLRTQSPGARLRRDRRAASPSACDACSRDGEADALGRGPARCRRDSGCPWLEAGRARPSQGPGAGERSASLAEPPAPRPPCAGLQGAPRDGGLGTARKIPPPATPLPVPL